MAKAGAVKKTKKAAGKPNKSGTADGFINVAVSRSTRQGLHLLKDAMGVQGQSEVIERLVTIGIAIYIAAR